MLAHLPRQGTHPPAAARQAGARLRRLAAVLAAVTCGLLASAAIVPAAFAMTVVPGPGGSGTTPAPVPATTIRVVGAGGMAGWQISLIALGAALLAAAAAVLLDRALAARRGASVPTA
ncbi:MAG: hypothetical protein ACLPQY_34740 [Streptosporangiaceae bacterium]